MPERNRGDRGALVALGLILAAIVLVAFFETGARGSLNDQGGNGGDEPVEERSEGNISQAVASPDDFDFWQDPFPQWAMAFLAAIATGTGVLGVIWIRQTLKATRDTAQAAIDANDGAREYRLAEYRPWIEIVRTPDFELVEMNGEPALTVGLTLRNSGRSPAVQIEIRLSVEIVPEPVFSNDDTSLFAEQCVTSIGRRRQNNVLFPTSPNEFNGATDDLPDLSGASGFVHIIACVIYESPASDTDRFHTAHAFSVLVDDFTRERMSNSTLAVSPLKGSASIG